MQNYKKLNNRETKKFHQILKEQFNFSGTLDYLFFKKKDKYYIVNKSLNDVALDKLKINSLGLYIAKQEKSGIRLSIEGSQLIGPKSNKNILELDNPDEWMQGKDVPAKSKFKKYVIIKFKSDYLGTGYFKENKILNYIPKSRRIKFF